MRKLGSVQVDVLDALVRYRCWYMNCGWNWTTHRETKTFMDRFVELRLARARNGRYYPTALAIEVLKEKPDAV